MIKPTTLDDAWITERVIDILVADIMESSDEEILNKARKELVNLDSEVTKIRSIINEAVMESRKTLEIGDD